MTPSDREALQALLARMCAIYGSLSQQHVGVCVLHLEAAIAALEAHLQRSGGFLPGELQPPAFTSAQG